MMALSSCGGSDDDSTAKGSGLYPAEIENNFLDSCERTAKAAAAGSSIDFRSYCACTLNHIEARETLAQFKADEQRLGRTSRRRLSFAEPSWPAGRSSPRTENGRNWARTSDLRLVEAALSQLSYTPWKSRMLGDGRAADRSRDVGGLPAGA